MPQANPFDQFDQIQSQNPFDQFDDMAESIQASATSATTATGPAMSAYEPSMLERATNWLNPSNPAAASNELVAQEIAQEQGVPVDDVYASVGGSRPTIDPQGRAGLSSVMQGFGTAGHQAQDASGKATGNYDKGVFDRMGEALPAGWDNMVGSLELGRFALAGGDVAQMAQKLSDKIGQNAQRAQQRTPGEAGVYGALGAVSDSSGLLEVIGSGVRAAGEFFGNPGDAAVISAEQAANSVPSLGMGAVGAGAGAVVGGVPGAIVGGRSGMATGTVATEFGAEIEEAIVDHLGAEGVNAPDRAQRIAAILQDPAFMSEAKVRAAKKGLTVAAMDQVFMTLGGKVASKAGAGSKVGAVGLDMAGESAGEATSQLVARGEVDAGDALLEGLAGGPTSIIETGAGYASEAYKSSPAYRRQQILKQLEQSVDATDIGGGEDAAAVNALRPDVGPEFVDPLNAAGLRNDDGSTIQGGLKTVQPFQTAEMPVDGSPVPFVPVPRTQTDEQERPYQPNGSEVEFESVAPQQQPKGAGLSLVEPNSNAIEYAPPAMPSRIDELAAGVDRGIKAHVDKQRASRLPSNLPDQRLNNPAYRSELERSLKGLDAQHKNMDSKVVEPKTDDLFSAIAKLGGINKAELEADGFDKADLGSHRLGIRPVFSKKGKSVDDMAEALVERGYLPERDVDGLKEMIRLQLAGTEQFSPAGIEHTMEQTQQIIRAKALGVQPLTAQKAITKALKGETLGKAELAIVKGALGLVGDYRGTMAAEVGAERQSKNEQSKAVRDVQAQAFENIDTAESVRKHLGSVPFDAQTYAGQAEAADIELGALPSYSDQIEMLAQYEALKAGVSGEIINELELRYSDTNQYIAALYRAAGQAEDERSARRSEKGEDSEGGAKASVAGESGRGHGRGSADTERPGDGRRDTSGRAERKHDTEPLFGSETDELLTDYTEEDLQKQAKEKAAREKAEADKQAKAEAKDKADSEASSFQLIGSDRKADANPAQVDLLDAVKHEEGKASVVLSLIDAKEALNVATKAQDKNAIGQAKADLTYAGISVREAFGSEADDIIGQSVTDLYTLSDKLNGKETDIDAAAHEAATSPKNDLPEPTEAQKEAGNYKVGRLKVHGLDISIENPKGSKRSGTAPDGKKWENTMGAHYGYIRKTEGADGDHVDVFVGDSPESESVWIIDQVNKDGSFDEHKVLLSFKNKITARKAYVSSYDKGWTVGPIKPMSIEQFKEWLKGDTTKPLSTGQMQTNATKSDQMAPDKPKAKPTKTPSSEGVSVSGDQQAIKDFGEKIGGARKDTSGQSRVRKSAKTEAETKEPSWRRRFEISEVVSSIRADHVGRWFIRDTRSKDGLGQARSVGERYGYASREEAEKNLPLVAVSMKHSAMSNRDGKYAIWRNVSDRKRVQVVEQMFDSRVEALQYMADHAEEIIETNTTFGEADLPKPPSIVRSGVARREGNVRDSDFSKVFGFRGVEFGNWNNQEERQELLNDAYDGLLDLAEVMAIPPKAISFGGELALAFGARGQGLSGARAHYERKKVVINLTKENGAGSLAHEWFHALDHYLARIDGKALAEWITDSDGTRSLKVRQDADMDYASSGMRGERSGMRAELREAYSDLIRTMIKKAEKYVEDTKRADDFVGRARSEVEKELAYIRRDLADTLDPKYYKRKNMPASTEQLAEFDSIAEKILSGEALKTEFRPNESKRSFSGRHTNDGLERINDIIKDVRGRQGFSAEKKGKLDSLRRVMGFYESRLEMLKEAKAGDEKVKMIATDFLMNAKELDQGRGSDYWTAPYELAARAFQGYVEDKIADIGGKSPFLNYGPENAVIITGWGLKRPYPSGEERKAINKAFDRLVETLQHKETEEGNVVLFSKSATLAEDKKPKGMEVQRVQKIAEAFLAKFKGAADGLEVWVRPTQHSAFGAGSRDRDGFVKAGFYPDRNAVVLIAANLDSHQDTIETLQHEILVHKGLGLFAPDVRERIISAVLEAAPQSPSLAPIWKRIQKDYHDKSDLIKAEEVIAAIAERRLSALDRFINKMLITFRKVLAAIGWTKPGLGNRDLLEMIYKIGDAFMEGKQAGRRDDLIERMDSRSTSTQSAYEQRIDELFAGAEPNNKAGVRVLDRSDVLDLLGHGDYEVVLAEKHAVSDGRFNHPQFTADDWKKVPEWLENPVAVFERDDGNLTVVAPELKSGQPIIIGVTADVASPSDVTGKVRFHLLLTAYNKDKGVMPLERMVREGQLRYIDQRKTPEFNKNSRHRLPSSSSELRGYGQRVYTGADLFKYRQTNGGAMFRKDTGGLPDPKSREGRLRAFFDGIAHQPIDRMFRLPFDALNLLDSHGRMKGSVAISEKAEQIIKEWKPFNGRFEWMNNILETARHGLIDRYKLSDEYVQTYREAEAFGRKIDMKALDMLKALEDRGVSGPEAAVLQQMLTGEQIQDKDIQHLGAPILEAIDQLGLAAVQYGIITREQFERNRGSYLHRSYMRHEGDFSTVGKWLMRKQLSKAKKIHGKTSKGRGIQVKADMDRLLAHVPTDWYGIKRISGKPDLQALNGRKFVMLENPGVMLSHTETLEGFDKASEQRSKGMIYWPADLEIPGKFEAYRNRGTFEVRGAIGNKVTLWRDYTKAERENMGEILDARYNIAKTFTLLSHDIAMGKFYQDIAKNDEWFQKELPPGVEALTAGEASSMRNLSLTDWVEVPDTTVEKSAGTKRWGALAGGYVRSEIWRDLNELDKMSQLKTWRKVITQWKINHTARSPVTHTNNVMSNLMWMDLADVRMTDLVAGIISYKRKDQHWRDAQEHGAFGGAFANEELRRKILEPILDDLLKQNMDAAPDVENSAIQLWKMGATIFRWAKKADQAMLTAYQVEDEIFRMATYMRRISLGDDPKEAARIAREQFIDYDIRAPWVNTARSTVLPFIGYTYRAIPNLAKSVTFRPWKLAKYITLGHIAVSLSYMVAPGDDEEEYRTMREDQQGSTIFGTPRMMRLPYRDEFGNPMFIDVRRWIPAGDVFDMNQSNSAIPVPAWLQFGGPLMIGFELALNKQAFTEKEIVNSDTDTGIEAAGKVADYLYKSWMPSAAYIPGSYYWDKAGTAWNGGRDILGRPYSFPQALLSSVGIKVQPHDVELGYAFRSRDLAAQARLIAADARRAESDYRRNIISAEEREKTMERAKVKLERLAEKQRELQGR